MTFVGVRIEGGFLEAGFKAATRREYEEQQRVVAAAADLFWPPQTSEAPDLSRDPAEPPLRDDFHGPDPRDATPGWQEGRRETAEWLERQGLR